MSARYTSKEGFVCPLSLSPGVSQSTVLPWTARLSKKPLNITCICSFAMESIKYSSTCPFSSMFLPKFASILVLNVKLCACDHGESLCKFSVKTLSLSAVLWIFGCKGKGRFASDKVVKKAIIAGVFFIFSPYNGIIYNKRCLKAHSMMLL
jgi:hypothetical protein